MRRGEEATVTGLLDTDEPSAFRVTIRWPGRELAVPLDQLRGIDRPEETAQAIADWHYWYACGNQF